MSLLTPVFLIAGVCAAVIPIILHFMMRGKPKKVEFPALRFVRQSFLGNRSKYRLRHWLLLLCRVVILIMLGLALARPILMTLKSGSEQGTASGMMTVLNQRSEGPVAMVLVIDTSVRMAAMEKNQTRLASAQSEARYLLSRLPQGSKAAIIDSSCDHDSFQVDLTAALEILDQLRIVPNGRSLPDSIIEALRLLKNVPLEDQEIFVITDRTETSWPVRQKEQILRFLSSWNSGQQESFPPTIYLIDCGQDQVTNISILDCGLASEVFPTKTALQFQVEMSHSGSARDDTLELHLLPQTKPSSVNKDIVNKDITDKDLFSKKDGNIDLLSETPVKAEVPVSFSEGDSKRTAVLTLSDLTPGIYQGGVRFKGGDLLAVDNKRWFTFEVRSDWNILVVSDNPTAKKSLFVREALAPEELRRTGRAPFQLKIVSWNDLDQLKRTDLQAYQAILLLDPPRTLERSAGVLLEYVRAGGGLGIFLGRNAQPTYFGRDKIRELLGAQLVNQVRVPEWSVGLVPVQYENLVLASFRPFAQGSDIPWSAMTVNRYWYMNELSPQLNRIIDYTDGRPALYLHSMGQGTVLVCTSPLSDLPAESPWNLWPTGDASWIFPVLMDGIARHLLSGGMSSRNIIAGQSIVIRSHNNELPEKGVLHFPNGETIEINAIMGEKRFLFTGTNQIGPYILDSKEKGQETFRSGFTVNYSPEEYNLRTLTKDDILTFFGSDNAQWLNQKEAVVTTKNRQRTGTEFYSSVVLLLAVLLLAEAVWSQRFYREK